MSIEVVITGVELDAERENYTVTYECEGQMSNEVIITAAELDTEKIIQ